MGQPCRHAGRHVRRLPVPALAIREYATPDFTAVEALWRRCGLARPWNDPAEDLALCTGSGHGAVLIGEFNATVVATVMVGHDGHRGWVYYLAVDPALQRQGLGSEMMSAAEIWLKSRGVPKVELMVRAENTAVASFYGRIGYAFSGVRVMERWLREPGGGMPGKRRIETTITYLEMIASHARPSILPTGKIALLRVPQPTVPFYRYLYNVVGENWFWYERRMMSDEALAAAIQHPSVELSVLYVAGEPAGYVEMDYRAGDDVNIAYFGLMPHAIGKGYGAYLLGWAIDDAWRRRPHRVWVHTSSLDHPRALRLYQRMGFIAYRQEVKVIDDPRESGIIPAETRLPTGARIAPPGL